MRLFLLFSALLAALTGVGASARAAEMPAVEQRASAAAEASVAVVATLAARVRLADRTAAPRALASQVVAARVPLYQDRLLE